MKEKERSQEQRPACTPADEGPEDLEAVRAAAQKVAAAGLAKIKAIINPKESAAYNQAGRQTNGQ